MSPQLYMCLISTKFSFFIEHLPLSEATAPLKKGLRTFPLLKSIISQLYLNCQVTGIDQVSGLQAVANPNPNQ